MYLDTQAIDFVKSLNFTDNAIFVSYLLIPSDTFVIFPVFILLTNSSYWHTVTKTVCVNLNIKQFVLLQKISKTL